MTLTNGTLKTSFTGDFDDNKLAASGIFIRVKSDWLTSQALLCNTFPYLREFFVFAQHTNAFLYPGESGAQLYLQRPSSTVQLLLILAKTVEIFT